VECGNYLISDEFSKNKKFMNNYDIFCTETTLVKKRKMIFILFEEGKP